MLIVPSGKSEILAPPSIQDEERLAGLLNWVYDTMDQHYIDSPPRSILDEFAKKYTADYLYKLNSQTHQTEDYIHLGAGLLVNKLKGEKDKFSKFLPPKQVKEFKEDAYAAKADLGITGSLTNQGFEVSHVQKHADAYLKGLRPLDIILQVNKQSVLELTEVEIIDLLKPEVGSFTEVTFLIYTSKNTDSIKIEAKSYFVETIRQIDTGLDGVLALSIDRFNQKSSGDLGEMLADYGVDRIKHLIIDLRTNKGGPPLSTREILGFFTPPQDKLFYYCQKSDRNPFF